MEYTTTFLFACPSFVEGVARALDFGSTLQEYNNALSGEQADALALQADLQAVADDMQTAVSSFEQDNQDLLYCERELLCDA